MWDDVLNVAADYIIALMLTRTQAKAKTTAFKAKAKDTNFVLEAKTTPSRPRTKPSKSSRTGGRM